MEQKEPHSSAKVGGAPLTKEEVRARRLLALGEAPADSGIQPVPVSAAMTAGSVNMSTAGPGGSNDSRIDAHGSMQEQGKDSSPAGKKQALEHARSMEAAELESLQRVMYRGGLACEEDMARWYTQGFVFCAQPCFGLRQASGGPCGVLAAVQAELVREMLFPGDPAQEQGGPTLERTVLPQAGELDVNALLAAAMSHILHRAATASSSNNAKGACQIQLLQVEGSSLHLPMTAWQLADLRVVTYATEEEARRGILQMLDMYSACTGCVSFLASAILSRGEERLRGDMDDPSSTRESCSVYTVYKVYEYTVSDTI
jgi:hypothetical protein